MRGTAEPPLATAPWRVVDVVDHVGADDAVTLQALDLLERHHRRGGADRRGRRHANAVAHLGETGLHVGHDGRVFVERRRPVVVVVGGSVTGGRWWPWQYRSRLRRRAAGCPAKCRSEATATARRRWSPSSRWPGARWWRPAREPPWWWPRPRRGAVGVHDDSAGCPDATGHHSRGCSDSGDDQASGSPVGGWPGGPSGGRSRGRASVSKVLNLPGSRPGTHRRQGAIGHFLLRDHT